VCPPIENFDLAHIRGTYYDRGTGVRFKINDKELVAIGCETSNPQDPDNNCTGFQTSYASLDPKNRGTGIVRVKACDHGEPGDVDSLDIIVDSGPYNGYHNNGPVLGGNFKGLVPF
jgi:hypothetical protein